MNVPSLPIDKFEAIYTEWEGKADLGEDVRRHRGTERARDVALHCREPRS